MAPLISYHGSHSSQFCDHTDPGISLEDVIKARIRKGFTHFGLTEHMPRFEKKHLYPEEIEKGRTPGKLLEIFEKYIEEAKRLQKEYAPQAQILLGFETDYCEPSYTDKVNELRKKCSVDYIVGSVHHVNGEPIDFTKKHYENAMNDCGGLDELFIKYYEHQFDLIEKCRPEVIGHIDLIKAKASNFGKIKNRAKIKSLIQKNIETAISYGAVFDVNFHSLDSTYPSPEILQMIKEKKGDLTLGDDSHGIKDLGINYNKAIETIKKAGFTRLAALEKRNGDLTKVYFDLMSL